ncbi:MAG: hypothetical protein ACP5IC_02730 [Minisyncoccia bacterium]
MNTNELIEKINKFKNNSIDLSSEEDLVVGIMNLLGLEEHFFFTAEKTGKDDYLKMLQEVREIRKTLLSKLISKTEGEVWCISKHLLAASYRLMEVGTKLQNDNKQTEAKQFFDYSYKLYTMFWGLRLKLIDLSDIKKEANKEEPWTLKDIVDKLVDCCGE